MAVHASHRGIQYQLEEAEDGAWRWSFVPPVGARRTGRVKGEYRFALAVVQRAVDVWHLMNRPDRSEAA
jgi:hypothetical protein